MERSREKETSITYSGKRRISYVQYKEGRLNGLVTSCVESTLLNTLLKESLREG